jgi:hypothetical protein
VAVERPRLSARLRSPIYGRGSRTRARTRSRRASRRARERSRTRRQPRGLRRLGSIRWRSGPRVWLNLLLRPRPRSCREATRDRDRTRYVYAMASLRPPTRHFFELVVPIPAWITTLICAYGLRPLVFVPGRDGRDYPRAWRLGAPG